jgi:hypothetical protein
MNSRRGSDVSEGGESNGVARLTFSRLDFESPTRIEQEERGGAALTVGKGRAGTLGLSTGYL